MQQYTNNACWVCRYFFVNAAILALGLIAFVLVARFYEEKAVIPHVSHGLAA
jgi:hypothetical protein